MEDIFQFMDVLSEVKLNRNDTEQQIFTKYFNNINQNMLKEYLNLKPELMKDIELSEVYRMKGNILYQEKNYPAAMSFYTTSLRLAPRDTTAYALTIANRSAVLYDLKRYKECLVDIERVFKSEYPQHMLYKIYMRQARCNLALKCYGKASKAAQDAKTSFETAKVSLKKDVSELIIKDMKDIEKSLENRPDTDKTVDDQDQSSLPVLTAGENPRFAYASNAVAMRKNKQRGRHVVASRDIKQGDVLFVEEPYSTNMHLSEKTYFTYCSECLTSSLTCIPCSTCSIVFCSDECRQLHWDTRHRWECAALRRSAISNELSLALGILFRASHAGFNTIIPDANVYGNKIDNYPFVNQLMTHKNNIPDETYTGYVKAAAWLVVYLIHFTDYFEWLYARYNRPRGSRDELHRMVGGLLLKFLCQIETNTEIIQNDFVARHEKYGIGLHSYNLACALYVSSSALNHACLPNTVKSFHGKTKVVRAISDIKKGTEITACYLEDPNMFQSALRQKLLYDEYYFTCNCSACTDEYSLHPWLCKKCRGPAFTTSDEWVAKCKDCQHTFQLAEYRQLQNKAKLCGAMYLLRMDFSIMQKAIEIMNCIYHKTNWTLAVGYVAFIRECENRGDIKSSLKYIELLVELYKAIYEPASEENVKILMKYSLTLVHYCLSLKYKKPGLYKKYLKRTKEIISNTTELLKYHMCEKRAVNYQQNMLRMLNVGDNFDEAMQLYHYNIIEA